ncbi:MAG: hypothetical protein E7633_03845 [Ruminococcaceae bacterium]|nr:hypothetical protein [Oscillospiraceae bacterium]
MFLENELKKKALPDLWADSDLNWSERREQIKDILQSELFGYMPPAPESVSFKELQIDSNFSKHFCAGKATIKYILIQTTILGKEFSFPICAVIPKGKTNLPFFIHINFRSSVPDLYMPTEEIIDNGFAVFSFGYCDVTSDDIDFTNGLAGIIYNGREPVGSECGKIPMWSWAASRVMDYCETLDCLDFSKSAVIGHSRLGKTALWTGMMDERFQFSISNDSGFAGAGLSRNRAEREKGGVRCSADFCVKHHMQWFCQNYRKYADHEEDMPYDQHFLVAASAPRYVYVGSALLDYWSDPESEYLSCCEAGKIYERLGVPGFIHPDRYPTPGESFHEGRVGYHIRDGEHFLSREDWQQYFKFIKSK